MKLTNQFTRSSAENSWSEFVAWIGFSTLVEAIERKRKSLDDWAAFKELAPRLFSIEYGLSSILQRWRSTRKIWYPKEKTIYDAYLFVGACIQIKKQLSEDQARIFRRRVISEILPNGRLCHLDHEFRTAQGLLEFGWNITHFGFCGDPGADFIAERAGIEVEVESKCLSPEVGLGVSYEFAARLMARLGRELKSQHPLCLTKIRIELPGHVQPAISVDAVRRQVIESYNKIRDFDSESLRVTVETSRLQDFFDRFPDTQNVEWLGTTFDALRTRKGDYGYFIRKEEELIFCNLVSLRPNQQAKKIMKLVSTTCERQFSKLRPALLWLHLQGLDPKQINNDPGWATQFLESLARHAFSSERRNHLSALVFTSDTELDRKHRVNDRRNINAAGHVKGYDNTRCRFGTVNILTPLFSTDTTNL